MTGTAASVPKYPWRTPTRHLPERVPTRNVEALVGPVRFTVHRIKPGTCSITRFDDGLFDGQPSAKVAIGSAELKRALNDKPIA